MSLELSWGAAPLVLVSAVAAPTITILSPENGKTYEKGQVVNALYSCADAPVECSATQDATGTAVPAAGTAVNTATVGQHYITVTARDATSSTQQQAVYFVDEGPPAFPRRST